jgi:hypothetical protein
VRKLLLFLLLLGAGLFVLYWLDKRGRARESGPTPAPEEVPVVPDSQTQGFQLDGPSQLTHYDEVTKRLLYKLHSKDTRTEGGVDLLTGVTLEVYDPEAEGVLQLRLEAERARPVREVTGGLRPSWEDRLELEGVHAEILAGIPLAPLDFDTPAATIDLSDENARVVTGAERFTAVAPELTLAGVGFEWRIDEYEFTILREGRIELLRAGQAPATLAASGDGPLRAFREGGPDGPVVLAATDGAVLEPGAQNPGRLAARNVSLRARARPGEEGELQIERLDADGNVDWTSGEARFQGQRLEASFLADGRVERARLDGEPRAELALKLTGGVLSRDQTPEERRVVLEGQEALEITWKDGGYALHLESPPAAPGAAAPARVPTLVTKDFRLQSAGTIDGWLSEDQQRARFMAGGGVVVTSGTATLETAAFELAFGPDENSQNGETLLTGTATGGARLVGELAREAGDDRPPRAFTLASPDGLKIERSSSGWRVIESTRVEVSLSDPDGFQARADRVSDFIVPHSGSGALAPEALRFTARGAVEVDFAGGRIGGEELDVLAVAPVRHFVVRGPSESKAYLTTEYGEASAREVEVTGDTLEARGEVTGSAEFTSGPEETPVRVTFAGERLTLDRIEAPELLPGERLRTLRLLVEENVECGVSAKNQTLIVKSARFSAENRVRLVEGAPAPIELGSLFIAEENVHADFVAADSDLSVDCDRFEVERTASDLERGFRQLTANGNVRFQGRFGGREQVDAAGECEILLYDAEGKGSMESDPHGRVTLVGRVPQQNTPFRLTAERVDFELSEKDELRLLALRPELRILGLRAHAEHFTADDKAGVVLSGAVRVAGATSTNVPYTLEAEEVVLVGRRTAPADAAAPEEAAPTEAGEIDAMHASGNVDFRLSDSLRARGERLIVRRANGLLRFEGAPASIEFGTTRFETEWVEFDPVLQVLVATGSGRVFSTQAAASASGSWTLDFLSASTLLELDSVVLVIQEPVFRTAQFQSALRATWAILWLNREAFQDARRRDELLGQLEASFEQLRTLPKDTPPLDKLTILRTAQLGGLVREIYFEGPVEVLVEGELLARADAMYLDVASQHGWLARATVNMGRQFLGQRQEKLIVKADWLRLSGDASLRADSATVTSCGFDDPHVKVVTGDLKIQPTTGLGKEHYQLRLRDNRIELYDLLRIPLPTIEIATDEELKPILPTLSLANSARFGTLFGFAFTRPADKIGRVFDSIARPEDEAGTAPAKAPGEPAAPVTKPKPRSKVDANYKVDGSYLGSRGGLLDLGIEIEAKQDYWFDLFAGLVYDTGEDRGFVRVPEDERDTLRRWLRSQAYFDRGKNEWTFSYSDQSDAAVQSEFFEGQFLRYERSETYVQWHRSSEENFVQGSAKVRVDGFRSDVEELPSFSGYRGRSPLLSLGSLSLIHTGDLSAEYLRRRTGSEPHSPFEFGPTFADLDQGDFGNLDGLGDREVVRLDTTQALEMPLPLGAGWKLTPFVSGRASAWSEGIDEEDEPTRLLAEAGARVGATYWKRGSNGKLHQFAPFAEYRAELTREDEDGTPVFFDENDRLLSGDFVRLGTRARFAADGRDSLLDVDVVGTHASNRSDGAPDGWMPIEVFGRMLLEPAGQEFEIFHDARYDLDDKRTVYSLVSVGTHFGEEWGLQFAHQRGLDEDLKALFESASISGLYRWTEKWEFEASESFSLLEDQELDTKLLVRRYGHDLVFELESSYREGEGSSFGVSLKPRFGYKPPRVGYVPW